MTIANEITREVVFTDYNCQENVRLEVVVMQHNGKPIAVARFPNGPGALVLDDIAEPDVLRSYAACLNAAADEMERMK